MKENLGMMDIDWSDKTTAASDCANWRRIVDQYSARNGKIKHTEKVEKVTHEVFFVITSSKLDRFSKFLHLHTKQQICNK